ncbi:WXG100 family type VII secretion target [Streptomyces sp. JW3]|uniref:WXG100 family type VII secretion target n=1 Tax=Streptomyces sp. JW3 TaxID=3456955 RepID=UPI003FA42747
MAGDKGLPAPVIESDVCVADPDRPQTKTSFINYSLKELKQMLEGTNPGAIENVGHHWGEVSEILAGDSDGGIAGALEKSIDNVLEHWEGEAAQAFEKEARKIAQSLRNAAWQADLNSSQMIDAGSQLRRYKDQLDDIKEPSGWAKVGDALSDWQWDNGEAVANDLKDRKLTTAEIAQINEGKIGASREAQLNGVAVMENLGAQYMRVTRNFNNNPVVDDDGYVGEPSRNVEYPPAVNVPSGSASRPSGSGSTSKPWNAGSTSTITPAPSVSPGRTITGATQLPTSKTKVDGIAPGLTGPSTSMTGGAVGGSAGGGAGGTQGLGVVAPGGGVGVGRSGGTGRGVGISGGRGSNTGGTAAGRGAGGRAGIGGTGAGAGAAGRAGAGAGGRGALAKSRGGVVGAAKGISSKGTGGGAGLHGSRGGTQRGAAAGGGASSLGRKGRRPEDENNTGDRPDYLVEDEETWISEQDRNRNVPRTIE